MTERIHDFSDWNIVLGLLQGTVADLPRVTAELQRLYKIESQLAAFKARTCTTCRHKYTFNLVDYCGRTTHRNQSERCELFGNTCGGWEPQP